MNKNVMIVGFVAALVLIGGFLYVKNSNMSVETMTTPAPTAATETGTIKEIVVIGSSFKFEPAEIKVNKGDKVKITFKNSGGTHDFVIDELNVKTAIITTGAEKSVEFIADKIGSFKYYCSVVNHRAIGMEGTLVVQ